MGVCPVTLFLNSKEDEARTGRLVEFVVRFQMEIQQDEPLPIFDFRLPFDALQDHEGQLQIRWIKKPTIYELQVARDAWGALGEHDLVHEFDGKVIHHDKIANVWEYLDSADFTKETIE